MDMIWKILISFAALISVINAINIGMLSRNIDRIIEIIGILKDRIEEYRQYRYPQRPDLRPEILVEDRKGAE